MLKGPSAQLFASLSLAIHEHKLLPGTKLGEDELSDIYKVSRTVVRTALQALSHSELVELKRNRGAFVSQPTVREAREVFEARALLEPRTARSAAERMTEEALERLEKHISAEHDALAAGQSGRALRLSGQFHIEISRIADQSTIAGFIERLVARSSLIIALYWKRQSALCEKHAHHALVDALRRGDGADAEELMKSHLLDILSALDLREVAQPAINLKDILGQ
ncbi:GntR family transcriptional regulator [Thalassococcus lentus]|uniref:GntR family transcriptional regulator n=1 Tax=Thalassococcus lentus TaxID=1210524 RepID=A0ABT4XUI6_9RHOB|nr:GntR family transcriptional regulator [Thalassococcus lentus]MDA7425624.1 GntR family transcriptional regulator [Thalassococcus lentus]